MSAEALHGSRVEQVAGVVRTGRLAAAVLCDSATLEWVSDGVPGLAACLVVSSEGAAAVTSDPAELRRVLRSLEVGDGAPVGIEPLRLAAPFLAGLGGRPLADVSEPVSGLRSVKSPDELAGLRSAAELASVAQRAFRSALRAGLSESETLAQVIAADARLAESPAIVDLMFGERTSLVGAVPTPAQRYRDDVPALFDFAPRLGRYWGDSCVTVCRAPGAEVRRLHSAAMRALERGIAAARPGLRSGDLDQIVRGSMREHGFDYPHFSGHGLGLRQQEPPFVVPGSDVALQESMVVALEPGSYGAAFGVRVEHVFVVGATGAELLTDYDLSLT